MASTQEIAQGLVAVNPNNGNPNTAYNVPAMNARGTMFSQPVNPAAVLAGLSLPGLPQLTLQGWQVPTMTGGGVSIKPVWNGWTTNPNWTPTPPPGNPGGGGNPPGGGPLVNGGGGFVPGGPNDPVLNANGGNLGGIQVGGNYIDGSGVAGTSSGGGFAFNGHLNGLGGGPGWAGGGNTSNFYTGADGLWGVSPGLASRLGMNQNGTMDWRQVIDVLSEPFIRGNFFDSQTGTWNLQALSNVLGANLLGIPGIGNILNAIGRRQLMDNDSGNDSGFFARAAQNAIHNQSLNLLHRSEAQVQNQIARRGNDQMYNFFEQEHNRRNDEVLNRLLSGLGGFEIPAPSGGLTGTGTVNVGGVETVSGGSSLGNNLGGFQGLPGGINSGFSGSGGALGLGTGLFGGGTGNFGGGSTGTTTNTGSFADTNAALQAVFGTQVGNAPVSSGGFTGHASGTAAGNMASGYGSSISGDAARAMFEGMQGGGGINAHLDAFGHQYIDLM